MPAVILKTFAKRTGKSAAEVEKLWNKAKARAAKEGRPKDWAYITGILKRMLGIKQEQSDAPVRAKEVNVAPKMTTKELAAYLDAKIRSEARWAVSRQFPDGKPGELVTGVDGVADDVIAKAASDVHDQIVSRFDYDENLLAATRAVKNFGVPYVTKVIKAALKAGALRLENVAINKAVVEAWASSMKGKKLRRKKGAE